MKETSIYEYIKNKNISINEVSLDFNSNNKISFTKFTNILRGIYHLSNTKKKFYFVIKKLKKIQKKLYKRKEFFFCLEEKIIIGIS